MNFSWAQSEPGQSHSQSQTTNTSNHQAGRQAVRLSRRRQADTWLAQPDPHTARPFFWLNVLYFFLYSFFFAVSPSWRRQKPMPTLPHCPSPSPAASAASSQPSSSSTPAEACGKGLRIGICGKRCSWAFLLVSGYGILIELIILLLGCDVVCTIHRAKERNPKLIMI